MCTNRLTFIPLWALALLLAGCTADEILETDALIPQNGSTTPSTLTNPDSADDGAVTTTFPASGGGSAEDEISGTVFTRLVTVEYSASGASVRPVFFTFCVSLRVSARKASMRWDGSEMATRFS